MPRILVLRPEPGASATVERARREGLDAIAVPLFEIIPVAWKAPGPDKFDGLLLTSANAVRLGGYQLGSFRSLKVYAVGEATGKAASEAGFEIAMTGEAGVDQLLRAADPGLRLLHLCGLHRRPPAAPRQTIASIVVYRSTLIEAPDLVRANAEIALIHSPEAGRRFAELIADRGRIAIIAISNAAARAVGEGWADVKAASRPSDDALLALAASLCNKSVP